MGGKNWSSTDLIDKEKKASLFHTLFNDWQWQGKKLYVSVRVYVCECVWGVSERNWEREERGKREKKVRWDREVEVKRDMESKEREKERGRWGREGVRVGEREKFAEINSTFLMIILKENLNHLFYHGSKKIKQKNISVGRKI